jgi:hypothetical protein
MYGTIVQNVAAAAFGAENALSAAADPDITQQNGQYIFTGPYNLLADAMVGASVTTGRYNVAQWNGWGRPNLLFGMRGLNPTSPTFWNRYDQAPLPLPQNQQIQTLVTNNLGASTEIENVVWQIGTADWSLNLPSGQYDFIGRATATITPTLNGWNENQAIAFDQLPLGGVYAVIGAHCVGSNAVAWRLNFPRTRMYLGRRLRPGNLLINALGNVPDLQGSNLWSGFGLLGYFHTFELPTLGVFGTAAVSTQFQLFLRLRFMGMPVSLLDALSQSNY